MWIDMHVSIVPTYAHMIWISSYILLVWKIYQWQVDNHIRISISGWDTYKWHQVIQPAATSSPSEIIFRPSAYRCSPICTLRSLSLRLRSLPRHSLGCKWGVWENEECKWDLMLAAGHKVAKQPGAKRPSLFTGDIGDPGTIKGGRRHITRHIIKGDGKKVTQNPACWARWYWKGTPGHM